MPKLVLRDPLHNDGINRRSLLKTAAAASVAFAAPALLRGQDPTKGGKRYRTALIGCGWWGGNIVREAIASGQCQIVALCDVDQKQIERLKGEQKELTADSPKVYRDYRELIENEKPEIVINATPRSLASPHHHRRRQSGRGRLCRETGRAHDPRRSGHGQRRTRYRSNRAGGNSSTRFAA